MDLERYSALESWASSEEQVAQTVSYVADKLNRFVREREQVLICFPKGDSCSIGAIFEMAVRSLSAIPVFWAPDHKWKTLLRLSFSTRATVIVGPPLVVLGLAKLAKATGTPLNIRHVITAGYPCLDWMIDGIVRGLDCKTWGCFGLGTGAIVGGFSCGQSRGVHIRKDVYNVEILDDQGQPLPDGKDGAICLSPVNRNDLSLCMRDHGRLERTICACGDPSPRLLDIHPAQRFQDDVLALYQKLHAWTSILDCRIVKGESGLELELVVFPGEKLPKLPTCAKQVIRPWDPERDVPFDIPQSWDR